MTHALEELNGKVSTDGGYITSLWFADNINAVAGEEQELEILTDSLDKICSRYKIEIRAMKTKMGDKQRYWHSKSDQGERTEAGY